MGAGSENVPPGPLGYSEEEGSASWWGLSSLRARMWLPHSLESLPLSTYSTDSFLSEPRNKQWCCGDFPTPVRACPEGHLPWPHHCLCLPLMTLYDTASRELCSRATHWIPIVFLALWSEWFRLTVICVWGSRSLLTLLYVVNISNLASYSIANYDTWPWPWIWETTRRLTLEVCCEN